MSEDNPWFQKLLEVIRVVVNHAAGRYAVGISHLRGPADVLVALLGSERLFRSFFDDPESVMRLSKQAARAWLAVARAQAQTVPGYRGGYGARHFGLWALALAVWLQDDTSSMMSLDHYSRFFFGIDAYHVGFSIWSASLAYSFFASG